MEDKFSTIPFENPAAAGARLQSMARNQDESHAFDKLQPNLLNVLGRAAYPDRVLINLEKLCHRIEDRIAFFKLLKSQPRSLETLVVLFAGSQYLTDVLIRNPDYLAFVKTPNRLSELKTRHDMFAEASDGVGEIDNLREQLDWLRRLQKRELLRIGAGDLLGVLSFEAVVNQLSHLARAMIRICLKVISEDLGISMQGFGVLALGKLGGRELNYSSDIDLLFVAAEYNAGYKRLAQGLIRALAQATNEGFLYRVDMRLRPWGQVGNLVPTVEENLNYLNKHAQLWEKQALRKARRVAGDAVMGVAFLEEMKPALVNLPVEDLRKEILQMKARIESELRKQGRAWGEVKGGHGSIRDVEFVTQYLQIVHGREHAEIQSRNTLDGLGRLAAFNVLPAHDYRILAEGYIFLRTIEHHLQIMHYRQTHLLPTQPAELDFLANRLGFQGEKMGRHMVKRYQEHSLAIRRMFDKYLSDEPARVTVPGPIAALASLSHEGRHLARLDASYSQTFSEAVIRRHAEMADNISNAAPVQVQVARIDDSEWEVTVVALDALGELSLICGLLFEYGFNILSGTVFTYERQERSAPVHSPRRLATGGPALRRPVPHDSRRKIVDVFRVRAANGSPGEEVWEDYRREVNHFVRMLRDKQQSEVHGELAKRVAVTLTRNRTETARLLPIEISFDNSLSEHYTVLRLDAPDTRGFLFELAYALALNGVYIAKVMLTTFGSRVHDTFYVTDLEGKKITEAKRQYQLRAATVLVKHFTHLLPDSPNPMSAMLHFREFISNLLVQEDWSEELVSLERPEVLAALSRLLGVSDFLWSDFLRMQHANLFPLLKDVKRLGAERAAEDLQEELDALLRAAKDRSESIRQLNAFKDAEMFRIDMRYIMGLHSDFRQFSSELSDLAEIIIRAAYRHSYAQLELEYGRPLLLDGRPCRSVSCGLGKLGGRELGVASDLELMFVYEGAGSTDGPAPISNDEFFVHLVHEFGRSVQSKQRGIFEIDLRMRPYGKGGNLAVTLDTFRAYYGADGSAWDYERQALVKLRPLAGDDDFGLQVISLRDNLIYSKKEFAVSALRAMRERQVRQLVAGGSLNAKFSNGGLVDLEYLVQGLQLRNGAAFPEIRTTNTEHAMEKLLAKKIISKDQYDALTRAYPFLRRLIEALRMVRGQADDLTVPRPDSDEFQFLARRLNYGSNPDKLFEELLQHTAIVQRIAGELLH